VVGLSIVLVAFLLSLALSLWAKQASRPEVSEPPGPPSVDGVVGYPNQVDVVRTISAARRMTERPLFLGFVAEAVQSDGTVDVSEGPGGVRYVFQSPEGQGAHPEREPGTLPRRHYCGKQTVVLRREGLAVEPDVANARCPPGEIEPLPVPRCQLSDVWNRARQRGVASDQLAHVEYYRSKAGPAFRFEIKGTRHQFSLDRKCERVLSKADSRGSAPSSR
jgi:hypothetical protein